MSSASGYFTGGIVPSSFLLRWLSIPFSLFHSVHSTLILLLERQALKTHGYEHQNSGQSRTQSRAESGLPSRIKQNPLVIHPVHRSLRSRHPFASLIFRRLYSHHLIVYIHRTLKQKPKFSVESSSYTFTDPPTDRWTFQPIE